MLCSFFQVDITEHLDGDNEHMEPPGEQDDHHSEVSDHEQQAGDHEDGGWSFSGTINSFLYNMTYE